MFFPPHQFPRAVLAGELAMGWPSVVVGLKALRQVFRVTDVEVALGILKDIHVAHGAAKEKWLQRQGSNLQPAG